ncbi:MerR family transcriptional regulator [Streptomyces sp. NBC_01304]|uniref:MerR family transcriptional regulator n=1 Tax=Streptomyces sp. NBC_01304 TaxID=2903818 RepID=UPI002E1168BD|nr:MerR family transcriptional regulator [Streptomyces sp. NBC_01304]
MRIAELSSLSGVAAPTIKYYLREGLMPPGERTSRNQAQYDDRHVRRLRLIRALLDVGGLSVAVARDVIAALDSTDTGTHKLLGAAQHTVTRTVTYCDDDTRTAATTEVLGLVQRLNWKVSPQSPPLAAVAEVLGALRELGQDDFADRLDDYALAADAIAATDLDIIRRRGDVDSMAEGVVLGNILGDALLLALRRLAQVHRSAELFES